ncbi:hypothetical protein GF380_02420 [Candidatus Uhrbacteria bacterium]|nr:hypothetical protein [Candidatus Uhrbacteria bacterium]
MDFKHGVLLAVFFTLVTACGLGSLSGLANINRAVGERQVYGAIARSLDAGTAAVRADTFAAHWEKYVLFAIVLALFVADRLMRKQQTVVKEVHKKVVQVVERGVDRVEAFVDSDVPYPGEL